MVRLLSLIKVQQPIKKKRLSKFTSYFKNKVALEALGEREPLCKIAKRYQIHATQVTEWNKVNCPESFVLSIEVTQEGFVIVVGLCFFGGFALA